MSGDICWCIVGEVTSDHRNNDSDNGLTPAPLVPHSRLTPVRDPGHGYVYGDEGCMEYRIHQSPNVKCFNTGNNNCTGSISIVSLSIVKIVPVGMLYRLSCRSVSPLIFDHPILETDWMIEVNWQYATEYGRGRGTPDTRGI